MPEETTRDFTEKFQEEFYRIYSERKIKLYEPALRNLGEILESVLDSRVAKSNRLRVRVAQGRVKSANRLLAKAQNGKYDGKITTPETLFVQITDIVGTRITCNTSADVDEVISIISQVVDSGKRNRSLRKSRKEWKDDYITHPKDSGYRAVHLLVDVQVSSGDQHEFVTCEIQIRTLLQDAWGELTHEDTYKPGGSVPAIVEILSKRLATTLAVLDEIAQDIRNELDRVERAEAGIDVPTDQLAAVNIRFGIPVEAVGNADTVNELPDSPPLAPEESLLEKIRAGFVEAFGRDVQFEGVWVSHVVEAGHLWRDRPAAFFTEVFRRHQPALDQLLNELRFSTVSDSARAAWLLYLERSPELTEKAIRSALADRTRHDDEVRDLNARYSVGRLLFGTVVHVMPDYALVQLQGQGDVGILHVTEMKENPWDYIDLHEVVHQGDTVRVEVKRVEPSAKRIELRLVRGDET